MKKKIYRNYTGVIPFNLDKTQQLHYPVDSFFDVNKWDPITKIAELTTEGIKIDFSDESFQINAVPCHWKPGFFTIRGVKWIKNYEFSDYLKFEGFLRGRSAAFAVFKGEQIKCKYTMFLTDLEEIIKRKDINHGTFFGNFTFCKRGQNYGIRAIGL